MFGTKRALIVARKWPPQQFCQANRGAVAAAVVTCSSVCWEPSGIGDWQFWCVAVHERHQLAGLCSNDPRKKNSNRSTQKGKQAVVPVAPLVASAVSVSAESYLSAIKACLVRFTYKRKKNLRGNLANLKY